MDRDKHVARHKLLHGYLDELVADYISHNRVSLSGTSVMQLIEWSFKQTSDPDDNEEGGGNVIGPN